MFAIFSNPKTFATQDEFEILLKPTKMQTMVMKMELCLSACSPANDLRLTIELYSGIIVVSFFFNTKKVQMYGLLCGYERLRHQENGNALPTLTPYLPQELLLPYAPQKHITTRE